MTLNTSVLITLALTLMRRCGEGCVETFPSVTYSSTECKNTMRTCSVTCQPGKIFYDGSSTKTYRCHEDNIWFPSVPRAGCKDKAQVLYWIRLTAKYHTSHVAADCLEAHEKALNDTIGNLTQPYLSICMTLATVGNISISNITSTTSSSEITTVLEFKLANTLTISARACAVILKINAKKFMTYDSPITCNTGNASNVTIKGDIVDSNITRCEDHYVLVRDSRDYNYCVLDIPVVGVNSTSYLIQLHEDVALHCEVQFGSVEYLYWQHDSLNITVDNARYSGGTIYSPSLTIRNVIHEDTGYYTCNAVSQSGTGTSLFINSTVVGDVVDEQTTVHHTPTSTGGLTDNITETSTGGLTDSITETSIGGLTDSITETSTGGQTDGITETIDNNARYSGGTIDSFSLVIHNVIYEDTGYYACNVVSQSGTGTSLFINLTVVGDVVCGITETSTGGLTDGITETFTDVLTDGITETFTDVLTDGITETSISDLKENDEALFIAIGVVCGGLIIAIVVLIIFLKRKTCSASPKRAYESTCNHEYSNEHFYAGLNDSTASKATQQHNLTTENYLELSVIYDNSV